MMLTLAQAQGLIPGSRLVGDGAVAFARVHSDTRSLQPGDLFVALKGERFDAHTFLPQAQAAGAVAALAEHGLAAAGLSGLEVPDTLAAMQTLAGAWRAQYPLPLVAVTGSNGKTTVTQMLASILRAWVGEAAFATQGNLNNHIGVPLTLLRLNAHHRAGVVELGMNHPGEIAVLAPLAAPTVALVNNAQREHQEFMATVEAAALENGAVISALPPEGVAVFPADDAHTPLWQALAGARRVCRFALQGEAEVTGQAQWQADGWAVTLHTPAGSAALVLRVAGLHNVKNALAACAAALCAGVPLAAVVQGLEAFEPVKGRSQIKAALLHGERVTLVDDSYNANPDSVLAAIAVLAALPGPRWLLLGDMGEVGTQGPQFHAEVGAAARAAGIEHFWAVGSACLDAARAYGLGAVHWATTAQAEGQLGLASNVPQVRSVLIKGSRFMGMERLVLSLQEGAVHAV
jgi:UDP-N-acetylmuramoyl-tripeptide--D-alanyl-D-alanine ligase